MNKSPIIYVLGALGLMAVLAGTFILGGALLGGEERDPAAERQALAKAKRSGELTETNSFYEETAGRAHNWTHESSWYLHNCPTVCEAEFYEAIGKAAGFINTTQFANREELRLLGEEPALVKQVDEEGYEVPDQYRSELAKIEAEEEN